MVKLPAATPFPPLPLDRTQPAPLYRQLYAALRAAILSGQLPAGTQLPATRTLARGLGVGRATVVLAYEQLEAEGYLAGRSGDGTYVAAVLPREAPAAAQSAGPAEASSAGRTLSRRATRLTGAGIGERIAVPPPRAFRPGLPALDAFPLALWQRVAAHAARTLPRAALAYGDAAGYRPLREAIAAHVRAARAVQCTPEQVIVVAGGQQGLDLVARVLLDPGDPVWVEDPGYRGARDVLQAAEARLVHVPVDAEGLDLAAVPTGDSAARLAYVTPSHQFPLGVTMSLTRRLALLDWAQRTGAWILEDDYDSEYRYAGRPLPALQGLDSAGRVIYLGTFSKVLFPALRLGFLVLPPDLVRPFLAMRTLGDGHPPVLEQATLAAFMSEGHLVRHIRRTRGLYAERQAALIEAAGQWLGERLTVAPAETGMHLAGRLPPDWDDRVAARLAWRAGVETPPVSAFGGSAATPPGVVLGYAAVDTSAIRAAVAHLATAWRTRPTVT